MKSALSRERKNKLMKRKIARKSFKVFLWLEKKKSKQTTTKICSIW